MSVGAIRESSAKSSSSEVKQKDSGTKTEKTEKPSESGATKESDAAAAREAEARREAQAQRQRDSFTQQRRQLVVLQGGEATARANEQQTTRASSSGAPVSASAVQNADPEAHTTVNELFSSELGRPCEDPARIVAEARASGASSPEQVKEYVQKMIAGSPEKAALNHINAQFQQHLGRGLTVPEQQSWLKGSGLNPGSPTFQQDVTSQIVSSEEYRIKHPANAQSWVGKVPLIDQRRPNGATDQNYSNGLSNCGPTSAAMVARALGYGEGKSDAALVMEMKNVGGTTAAGSSPQQVAKMIRHTGTPATVIDDPKGLGDLDKALSEGKMVIVNGDYYATGVEGRDGSRSSGHFCVVTGKDAQGNYLINDPWKGEAVKFSRDAMQNFFSEHKLKGGLVIIEKPGAGAAATQGTPSTPFVPSTPSVPVPATGLQYDGGKRYNAEVEKLQNALVKAGYMRPEDMATGPGHYGNKTAAAVARLQADSGINGDGKTFGPRTREALERRLSAGVPSTTPGGPPAPAGGALPPYALNAPGNNAQDRYYYAHWVKDNVMPRLQQLGVDPKLVKQAVWFGVSEGIFTVARNGKYGQENGSPQSPLTFSNLGDDPSINRTTSTPEGFGPYRFKSGNWQVGIAGAQVHDAIVPGNSKASLVRAFKDLYPNNTVQQVGQRMLDMMGEKGTQFPNLSIEDLVKLDANGKPVNAKWASIVLRDPAINVLVQTRNPAIQGNFGYGKDIVDQVFG
jgi:peptidoglycan hydrolase-like protein with peptidoglycan-binding domain